MNAATASPCRTASAGIMWHREHTGAAVGWSDRKRANIARQCDAVSHWRVQHGTYRDAPDINATWFVDPPYKGAGKYYKHSNVDYADLAGWCRERVGQTIVCEGPGADWLPFKRVPWSVKRGALSSNASPEFVWTNTTD